MARPDVAPSLLNIARITSGITDRIADGDNDDINVPAYRFNEAIPDAQSLANTYYDIGQGFKTKVLGEGSNANSDMAGLDMTSFLQTAYAPRGNYNRSMVDNLGGYSELLRAYDQLGVTGDGDTYADRQVRGVLDQFRANSSSINSDGTGGSIDAGTADVKNFSLENAYNAFAPMPPSGPIGLAFSAYKVINDMYNNNTPFPQAVSNSLGYGPEGNTTTPGFGFGSESNETGPVGPGFAEGGLVTSEKSLTLGEYHRSLVD